MAYSSLTLTARYLVGYKTSDSVTAALISDSVDDATNEINKYLAHRYDVAPWGLTLSAVPPIIGSICKFLAAAEVIDALGKGGKETTKRADILRKRAIGNLEMLASGEAILINTAGSAIAMISDPGEVLSTSDSYSNTFNEDDPYHWKTDATKILDIASERS